MAGGGVALIGMILVPLLKGAVRLIPSMPQCKTPAPARLTRAGGGKRATH